MLVCLLNNFLTQKLYSYLLEGTKKSHMNKHKSFMNNWIYKVFQI